MKNEFIPYEHCFGKWLSSLQSNWKDYELILEMGMNEEFEDNKNVYLLDKVCSAPLYQQAFRWFREKYNLEGIPQHAEDRLWYKFHISTYLEYGKKNIYAGFEYPTYEKAEYACLNKLIEIVKNK